VKLIKWFVHLFWRLLLLPFKVFFATVGTSFRLGTRVAGAPVKVGVRATRAAGFSGIVCLVLGVAIGLLVAPETGRELRAKLLARLGGGSEVLSDDELAEKITFELGHAPRTWHLPQPQVYVTAGRAQLRGAVSDGEARDELVRVASAIPGVAGVEDLLEVEAASR
jgi:hypothetical protein